MIYLIESNVDYLEKTVNLAYILFNYCNWDHESHENLDLLKKYFSNFNQDAIDILIYSDFQKFYQLKQILIKLDPIIGKDLIGLK